jgi:dienelactone hydrolase
MESTVFCEDCAVKIPAGELSLDGDLEMPPQPRGVVLFAHGSGSSRFSKRNRYVAGILRASGLATLLMELLTRDEESVDLVTAELRFDIDLLARRVVAAIDWLGAQPASRELDIGLFGASTGAAAALKAAAERAARIGAVVSRGGRPDLAGTELRQVQAPTLLIVGGDDAPVIGMNREALAQLQSEKQLEIIPGATHLFEEPGTLEQVARLARDWFMRHLKHQGGHSVAA